MLFCEVCAICIHRECRREKTIQHKNFEFLSFSAFLSTFPANRKFEQLHVHLHVCVNLNSSWDLSVSLV